MIYRSLATDLVAGLLLLLHPGGCLLRLRGLDRLDYPVIHTWLGRIRAHTVDLVEEQMV